MRINIIANSIVEPGMSGGNKIFIECAKRWLQKGVKIRVFTTSVGKELIQHNGLTNIDFQTWHIPFINQSMNGLKIFLLYIIGTIRGTIQLRKTDVNKEVVYSSSDYWPDTIPALTLKLFKTRIKWVAGFYLFAPKPWDKTNPYKKTNSLIGWLYWLSQLPIYWLIKKWADMVFITSQPDVNYFITDKRDKNKIIVVQGGVDFNLFQKYPEPKKKKYEAVFMGRLHPQKGVLELIDIWQKVVNKKPKAKLAIIGHGSLLKNLIRRMADKNLTNNIDMLGFLDGEAKIRVLKSAKIVVHPAIYDSGGMASMEAMACGLPGVSFDLDALRTYYPKGMIKTPCFDIKKFCFNICRLLDNKNLYNQLSLEALGLAKEWDWDKKAKKILKYIQIL